MNRKHDPLDLSAGIITYEEAKERLGLPPTAEQIDRVYVEVIQVVDRIRSCTRWAWNNRPRLVHLALHAKRRRARKKNLHRIIREYIQEVNK